MLDKIFWRTYTVIDSFSGSSVTHEGYSHVREAYHGHQPIGIYDSYVSALAGYMGLWEEYCEYHRTKY